MAGTAAVGHRVAIPAEGGRIGAIGRAAYGHYERQIGVRPRPLDEDYVVRVGEGVVWVDERERGEEIRGFIILERREDHLWIDNVAVDPPEQGRGLGRSLLEFAERRALELGLDELRLLTSARMIANVALYRHLGYVDDPEIGVDDLGRLHMRKRLG